MEEVEAVTGFVPGKRSWPFAGILALANLGLSVRTIDMFDASDFAADPVAAVTKWYPDDTAERDRLIRESDLDREAQIVRDSLANPLVTFEARVPTWRDLRSLTQMSDTTVMARVNHRALVGKAGFYGHYVVVDQVSDSDVLVQDPGPPARDNYRYPREVMHRAWCWPDDDSAELIVVQTDGEAVEETPLS